MKPRGNRELALPEPGQACLGMEHMKRMGESELWVASGTTPRRGSEGC